VVARRFQLPADERPCGQWRDRIERISICRA
jgi:hypothetical protein